MYRIPVAASIPVPVPEASKTVITFTNSSSHTIEHSSTGEPLDNDLLISEGVKSSNYTWKYQPANVSIGNRVTSIGNYAFYSCRGLTSVTIPDSVTSIGSYAFENCSGLTSVTIPDSVTSIGNRAFMSCSGLTNVSIPNGVISISELTFSNCSGLTSVTIPNSVTSIGNSAFYGSSINEIWMRGFTKQDVINNALNWGLGINDSGKFTVVVYCIDGILVLNGGSGSSGAGSSGARS